MGSDATNVSGNLQIHTWGIKVVLENHHFPSSMNTPHTPPALVSTELLGQQRSSPVSTLLLLLLVALSNCRLVIFMQSVC